MQIRGFSTSSIAFKKKSKGDISLVWMTSTVSEHRIQGRRQRLGDKLETLEWDPLVQKKVLFKESKKIKTISDADGFWTKPSTIERPDYFQVKDN